ncbi:hypothetical protein DSO57_1020818 [Entomophthora muscae]|uniref:Uncharacterized protein n=1 Tax=Entomophthora muscae TaxID=34485 RepID=A0ACC2SSG2_9FUNG|nr:hypothetical protein DSO57_1020818 [Entomophthora muscae]
MRKEPLFAPEAQDTVVVPYVKQLALPVTEVTHKSDSAKKISQLLKSVHVTASLEKLNGSSLTLSTALESFLSKYKNMDVYRVMSLVTDTRDRKDYTYIDIMVHKVEVSAIIDSDTPGNIVCVSCLSVPKVCPGS